MGVGPVLGDLWQMAVFEKAERCLSTTSPMARFGGVQLRGLDNRRVLMYTRRLVELFGTMAASTEGLTRIILWCLS